MRAFNQILWEEEGATAVEYGLLTALIAWVMAGGAVVLGQGLNTMFGTVGTSIDSMAQPAITPPSPTY